MPQRNVSSDRETYSFLFGYELTYKLSWCKVFGIYFKHSSYLSETPVVEYR